MIYAFLQAAAPATENGCLTIVITWAPIIVLLGLWALLARRMGYFSRRRGYVKRSEDHMDRVEQTLNKIEEHLRKIAERDRAE